MDIRICSVISAVVLFFNALPTLADVAGTLTIAGNGPEQRMMESLAHAFEKAHPRAYLDVLWDDKSKPIDMIKAKQAQIAVSGTDEAGLRSRQIAWDGITIMVHR